MYLFLLITSTSWENDHTSLYFGRVDIEYICNYIHTILNTRYGPIFVPTV